MAKLEKKPRRNKGAAPVDRLAQEIGAKVRTARVAAGLSQGTLGESVCISQGAIADIESGRRRPSLERLEGIAKYLGLPIRHFFPEE